MLIPSVGTDKIRRQALLTAILLLGAWPVVSLALAPPEESVAVARATFARLPIAFETSAAQDPNIKFVARGPGYNFFLTRSGLLMQLHANTPGHDALVDIRLVGANRSASISAEKPLSGKSNYFVGNDPTKWRRALSTYGAIAYSQIYPGVNLRYYGNQRSLEFDFIVAPGGNPRQIEFEFRGAGKVRVDSKGNLLLATPSGTVAQHKPRIYQDKQGLRRQIAGGYRLRGSQRVGIQLAAYDPGLPLIIDPVVAYATYLGGGNLDRGYAIATDANGSVYVTGSTLSSDFPTVGSFQGTNSATARNQVPIAFVTKFFPFGNGVAYSTYLGGSGSAVPGNRSQVNRGDRGTAIAVDASGQAFITGSTDSSDFPTLNALQRALGANASGRGTAFVTKLSPAGNTLIYSTYLGGSGGEVGNGIAIDTNGSAYVTGTTTSADFPTANAFQAASAAVGNGRSTAFVTKLNAAGNGLVYSTYLGGSGGASGGDQGLGIALDANGNAYVTGFASSVDFPILNAFQGSNPSPTQGSAFVTKFNASGNVIVYSTYLGGSAGLLPGANGFAAGIAVNQNGEAYVVGTTTSPDFPTVKPFQTGLRGSIAGTVYLAKLAGSGNALVYSTYLGGTGGDFATGIALNAAGEAYVAGFTNSTDFPTTNANQPANSGAPGCSNAFVAKFTSDGSSLLYSTYLGGSLKPLRGSCGDQAYAIAVDANANAYVTGLTYSGDFPTVNALEPNYAGNGDAFVVQLGNAVIPPLPVLTTSVVEFYDAHDDLYVISGNPGEIAWIDAGNANLGSSIWKRTGQSFKAYVAAGPGNAVCRFFNPAIRPLGSHFYTANPNECQSVLTTLRVWTYEGTAFNITLPSGGLCPVGFPPVYRYFDNRADRNWRFVTDSNANAAMTAAGWVSEGIQMCASP